MRLNATFSLGGALRAGLEHFSIGRMNDLVFGVRQLKDLQAGQPGRLSRLS
jgi:hypothetical protein